MKKTKKRYLKTYLLSNRYRCNARDIDVMMLMYNLTECSDNYSETSRSLWQRYRDDPNDNKKI